MTSLPRNATLPTADPRRGSKLPLLAAAAVPCLPLLPLLLAGQTLWFRDFSLYFLPMKALLVELWRGGHLPLWDPFVRNGLPFLANPQTGVFYPPSLLLVLLGLNPGLALFIVLHFAVASAGFYVFLRGLRFPDAGALLGALGLGLGGYLASLVNVLNNLQAAAWIPWILAFAVRVHERPGRGSWIGLAAVLALSILGGELQLTALGAALALALVLVLEPPGSGVATGGGRRRAAAWRVGTAAGAAACLTAIQLLPTAELLGESVRRGGLPLELASADALQPAALFSLVFPRPALPGDAFSGAAVTGQMPWLLSAYLGAAIVWLAALGLFGPRRRWTLFWCAAALAGVLLALGSRSALFRLAFELVPPFRSVRYPEKFLLLTALAAPALAAAGMERVLERRIAPRGLVLGGALLVLSGAGSLLWMQDPSRLGPGAAVGAAGAAGAAVLTLLMLVRAGRVGPASAATLLLAVAALDLSWATRGLNPGVAWSFYDRPWAAEVLRREGGDPLGYRVRSTPLEADMEQVAVVNRARIFSNHYLFQQSLAPNLGQLYGFLQQDGMSGIETRGSADLIDALVARDSRRGLRLLSLLSVEYAVTSFPLPAEDVVQVAAHPELPVGVVRLRAPLPRAYLAARWEVVPEPARALERALSDGFAPAEEVVLDRAPAGAAAVAGPAPVAPARAAADGKGGTSPGAILGARWEPAGARLDVELVRPAVLVMTDSYYPGWRASVDGSPAQLLRANGYLRAVPVPAGRHRVVLDYRPASFTRGAAISAGSLIILGLAGLPRGRRHLRADRAAAAARDAGALEAADETAAAPVPAGIRP